VGTGDFTHPVWIQEPEEKLESKGNGLFRLKNPPKEQGLPSRDLLQIVPETSTDAHLIPAHVWTPWFSKLSSKAANKKLKVNEYFNGKIDKEIATIPFWLEK